MRKIHIDEVKIVDEIRLPAGDDPVITQKTFTFSFQQAREVDEAIKKVKKKGVLGDGVNKNSNGNALHQIIKEWAESA
jgi:hypothetical protein